MQSLVRQMTSNPSAMQSLLTSDSIKQMNQFMSQNPAFLSQVYF